jgi:transcription termination factor NusB
MVVHLRPKQTCQKLTQSLKFERIDVLAQKLVIMTALESYRINDTPKNYKVKGADSLMRHHLKCVVITRIRALDFVVFWRVIDSIRLQSGHNNEFLRKYINAFKFERLSQFLTRLFWSEMYDHCPFA